MPVETAEIDRLRQLTRAQLDAISRDFMQPLPVQRAARAALRAMARDRLIAAVQDFDAASPVFVDITHKLRAVTEAARKDPVGDAVSQLTMTLRRFGEVFDKVEDIVHEPPAKTATVIAPLPAEEPEPVPPDAGAAGPADTPAPAPVPEPIAADDAADASPAPPTPPATPPATPVAAPPPGAATRSTRFGEIAGEYAATFTAAGVLPDRVAAVDRTRRKLLGFADDYREVEGLTGVPWHVIGLIHGMESSFNFGSHLHNGDSLAHRTRRVPAGRPSAEVADPPFTWTTSAVDALTHGNHRLNLVQEWSLARQLFELERYNGFGYRFRGLATPYLWSGSDRYVKGKFVRDGVFDPDAVSGQLGAAVILKALQHAGDV